MRARRRIVYRPTRTAGAAERCDAAKGRYRRNAEVTKKTHTPVFRYQSQPWPVVSKKLAKNTEWYVMTMSAAMARIPSKQGYLRPAAPPATWPAMAHLRGAARAQNATRCEPQQWVRTRPPVAARAACGRCRAAPGPIRG